MRYEVSVQTNLAFHTRGEFAPPIRDLPRQAETVAIEFEGRRFLWHAVPPLVIDLPDRGIVGRVRNRLGDALGQVARYLERVVRQDRWPTVTTPIEDAGDYESERLAMARFLSALAYETQQGMEVQAGGGAGMPAEFDPPIATGVVFGPGYYMRAAPAEVVVVDDDRLRLVLGYYREALGIESPYFKFLAYWNALEVACEDASSSLGAWIRETMEAHPGLGREDDPPADWSEYLYNERRHAVAHAVRDPKYGVPDLDTDEPDTRGRFYQDARLVGDLVRLRVGERWGPHAVYFRRR